MKKNLLTIVFLIDVWLGEIKNSSKIRREASTYMIFIQSPWVFSASDTSAIEITKVTVQQEEYIEGEKISI